MTSKKYTTKAKKRETENRRKATQTEHRTKRQNKQRNALRVYRSYKLNAIVVVDVGGGVCTMRVYVPLYAIAPLDVRS